MATNDQSIGVIPHVLNIFTGFLGPLIMYFIVEDKDKFAKDNCKTALNWAFSSMIYYVISAILILVFIGIFLIWALYIMTVVFSIMAAVKASKGEVWKYPMSIQFFKVN